MERLEYKILKAAILEKNSLVLDGWLLEGYNFDERMNAYLFLMRRGATYLDVVADLRNSKLRVIRNGRPVKVQSFEPLSKP